MSNFFDEQGRTRVYDEAYDSYVEKVNPRRTQRIGKRAISGWKLISTAPDRNAKEMIRHWLARAVKRLVNQSGRFNLLMNGVKVAND